MASCPLSYTSGNASPKRDVLGTWLLSILAGHHRYAHITALRGDGVSPQLLGMTKIVSEDALRRALARMSAAESRNWLRPQLPASVETALNPPWILDIDTTIKTLYSKQSGADVSYNPHKPGRPSHALHTYFVSHLRMVLDVVVCPGKEHAAAHARPGLSDILDRLGKEQLPALVRGDCGYGNEPFIAELEKRGQPYLFNLRQTSGVKKLLMRQFARQDWTTPGPCDRGWSAVEDILKLVGWDTSRRGVILRRAANRHFSQGSIFAGSGGAEPAKRAVSQQEVVLEALQGLSGGTFSVPKLDLGHSSASLLVRPQWESLFGVSFGSQQRSSSKARA